jgi:hypothetical protein
VTRPALTTKLPTLEPAQFTPRFAVSRAIEIVAAHNDPPRMFVRGGQLARVRSDENEQPLIETFDRPADDAALRTELDARIEFGKWSAVARGKEPEWKPIHAPKDLVGSVRTNGTWPGIPALEAIVQAPTIRADGEIVDEPGYDEKSRLLYHPGADLQVQAIPRRPPRDQVTAAVDALDDLLADFPFATDSGRANAFALLLTPLVRPAIAGPIPLALVSGTKAGTGKGLLIEVASRIATGRPPGLTPVPPSDEEMAKVIGALMLAGATFVAFDEADELRAPSLALALTASVIKPRILGQSSMAELPQRATWVAAGNNIQIRGDLHRRCYWIRLDAKVARPYERTGFRHPNLIAHVAERRGDLITAALTIARAWYAAGRPPADLPTFGGFEPWAKTLGGILAHAGIDGFLNDHQAENRRADEESADWEAFLTHLRTLRNGDPFTAGDILAAIHGADDDVLDALPDDLANALQGATPASARSRLGKALDKREGTRFGDPGYHLVREGRAPRGGVKWRIDTDAEVAQVAEVFNLPTRAGARGRTGIDSPETSETSAPLHTTTRTEATP